MGRTTRLRHHVVQQHNFEPARGYVGCRWNDPALRSEGRVGRYVEWTKKARYDRTRTATDALNFLRTDWVRPTRTPYTEDLKAKAIVIDNGSYHCRVGWAGETNPRVDFRSVYTKARNKTTGVSRRVVGDFDPSHISKAWELSRTQLRSPFDGDIVSNFDTQETLLDFAFEKMSLGESGERGIPHPMVITETLCNPSFCRTKMAETLFEVYGAESVQFGQDFLFSDLFNRLEGNWTGQNSLIVSAGHSTTFLMPVLNGVPAYEGALRLDLGGMQLTSHLLQSLTVHYPATTTTFNWFHAEHLKHNHCYVAEDYDSELGIFQEGTEAAHERTVRIQLPWQGKQGDNKAATMDPEEAAARKAEQREKAAARLREMAAQRKEAKISELETTVSQLQSIEENVAALGEEETKVTLAQFGFSGLAGIAAALADARASLARLQGKPPPQVEEELKEEDPEKKYPLLYVPDDQLSEEDVREKKRQRLLKNSEDGRRRKAEEKAAREAELAEQRRQEDEEFKADPEGFLERLRAKHRDLAERLEVRKNGKGGKEEKTNVMARGRGARVSTAQRERMKLMAEAAFGKAANEEMFGASDADWNVYKSMDAGDGDEEELAEEEAEYQRTAERLRELDPASVIELNSSGKDGGGQDARPPVAEDYQIFLTVERIKVPEILFQPHLCGVDQVGIPEMFSSCLRRLEKQERSLLLQAPVHLTGGSTLFPGFKQRVVRDFRMLRDPAAPLEVVLALDPLLDAWRGASRLASSDSFTTSSAQRGVSRTEYEEQGERVFSACPHLQYMV